MILYITDAMISRYWTSGIEYQLIILPRQDVFFCKIYQTLLKQLENTGKIHN